MTDNIKHTLRSLHDMQQPKRCYCFHTWRNSVLFVCSQRHWGDTGYFRFWKEIVAATTNCLPLLEMEQ